MLTKRDRMHIVNRVYRHKIAIWDLRSTEENEIGAETQVPVEKFVLWAEVQPTRGREFTEAHKTSSEQKYKVTTHFREGIDPSMEIRWGQKKLNIDAVIDVSGREEQMELMCTEKVKPSGRI